MSKGLKSVLAVAAAIAIPYAAPALFGALTSSMALGTFATVAGSAATGAALGAASSKLLGGNARQGALFGAIGGGAGAYFGLGNTATGPAYNTGTVGSTLTPSGTATGGAATMGGGVNPVTLRPVNAGLGTTMPSTFGASAAPVASPTGLASASAFPVQTYGSGMAPTFASAPPVTAFPGVGGVAPTATTPSVAGLAPSSSAFTPTYGAAPAQVTAGVAPSPFSMGSLPAVGAAAPSGATAAPLTFTEAIKQVPGQLAAKFRDPQVLADMTLRAGAQIAGSALAGSGLSDEEQQLLNQQTEELRALRTSNEELFRQRLQAAQDMIGESRYFDPEYFGLQSARRTQTAAARASAAGTRGMTGERRRAEERRYALASGRDVGTAYDAGYSTGVQGRLQTRQAGLSALPSPLSYNTTAGVGLLGQEYARQRRREAEEGFGRLAAPLYT
jgi:hypothetical protein